MIREQPDPEDNGWPERVFVDRLRRARELSGMSLEEAAASAGVSVNRLAQIERWQADAQRDEIHRLATLYEVSYDYLFGGDVGWRMLHAGDGSQEIVPDQGSKYRRRLTVVPLSDIDAENKCLQFRLACDHQDLVRSLRTIGLQQPILLLGSSKPYQIIAGNRRLAAAQELGWQRIEAWVHEALPDQEAFMLAYQDNEVRKNFSPLERGFALSEARKRFGLTVPELARRFDMSQRTVERYLKIIAYPNHILGIVDGKVVNFEHARVLDKYHVRDAKKWRAVIEDQSLDSRGLERSLKKDRGVTRQGRRKQYLTRKNGTIAFAVRITDNTLESELRQMLEAMRQLQSEIESLIR